MNYVSMLGIIVAAAGFLLWGFAYIYFRKFIKPLGLPEKPAVWDDAGDEKPPELDGGQKKKIKFYNTMLMLSCMVAFIGCIIAFVGRSL